jgi:hypothetical protein
MALSVNRTVLLDVTLCGLADSCHRLGGLAVSVLMAEKYQVWSLPGFRAM